MKTKFWILHLWKTFFSILFIAFHIQTGLCRPSLNHVDADSNLLQNVDHPNGVHRHHQSQLTKSVYDLKSVGPTEIYDMRADRRLKNNDTLILYSGRDLIHFLSGDVSFIGNDIDVDDAFDDVDTPTHRDDDVSQHVIFSQEEEEELKKEGSSHRRHQVLLSARDRNLVRKRRQPDAHKPHRRRRRKHRLVLKARDRNHLSEEEDLKDRRHKYLIKSDSPTYVITSASEIKKDWCRTIPLRQKVSEPHCRSRVVQNNFCYGQCNSFFIPHIDRTDSNKVAFQSCAFCKPFKQHWGNVTLNCPGRIPPKVEKTVLFVETCRCITEVFQ